MNSVVERRATTTAGTGRPDRVALYVCVCVGGECLKQVLFILRKDSIEES